MRYILRFVLLQALWPAILLHEFLHYSHNRSDWEATNPERATNICS